MKIHANEKSLENPILRKLRLSALAAGITILLGSPLANAWTESPDGFSWLRQTAPWGNPTWSLQYYNSLYANHVMGDVDGDGDTDIVATDQGTQTKRIYLNRGDGCFGDSATDGLDDIPATYWGSVALGDFDGDGDLDLFSGNENQGLAGPGHDEIWMNDGAGNFSNSGQVLGIGDTNGPRSTKDATVGDADSDGDLDVLVSNNSVYLYLNDGNGNFDGALAIQLWQSYGSGSSRRGSRFADLDGDGDLDVWITVYQDKDVVLWNVGSGGNVPASGPHAGMYEHDPVRDRPVSLHTHGVAFSDFDGDGDLDVMAANNTYSANRAFQNNGDQTFTQVWADDDDGSNDVAGQNIDAGDIDGDGDIDFATNRTGYFTDYANTDPALKFRADPVGFPGYTSMTKLADVDGDGDLDSVTTTRYGIIVDLWKETDGATRCDEPIAVSDTDEDGIDDDADNCPDVANADQTDSDMDGFGDVCDDDDDNDGQLDGADNCPLVANPDQLNTDGDGIGDACDADLDGDGVLNDVDNCPAAANVDQTDTNMDGQGDECDTDDDGDGVLDGDDNCPSVYNTDQADGPDGDGIGDACDSDLDGDGVDNGTDNCPIDANAGQDNTDSLPDGGDACDFDDDEDGVQDTADNCPLIINPGQENADGDGDGDVCDADLDGDGVANEIDNCPVAANSGQTDLDGDGVGDTCDADIDGDGVDNAADNCAATPLGAVNNANGCTIDQLCPCDGPGGTTTAWKNHGKYVSCVAHAANDFRDAGLISDSGHGEIVSEAGMSNCGHKN